MLLFAALVSSTAGSMMDLRQALRPATAAEAASTERPHGVWFRIDGSDETPGDVNPKNPVVHGDTLTLSGTLENEDPESRTVIVWATESGEVFQAAFKPDYKVQGPEVAFAPVTKALAVVMPPRSKMHVSQTIDLAKLDYAGAPRTFISAAFYLTSKESPLGGMTRVKLPLRRATAPSAAWVSFRERSTAKQACSPEATEKSPLMLAAPPEVWLERGKPLGVCLSFFNKETRAPGSVVVIEAKEIDGLGRAGAVHIRLDQGKTRWVQPRISEREQKQLAARHMNVDYANSPQSDAVTNPFALQGLSYMSYDLNEFRDGTVSIFENSTSAGSGEGKRGTFELRARYGELVSPPVLVHFRGQIWND